MAPLKFKITWRKPGQLKPYKDNPRHHTPDGVAKIAAAIEAFGWRAPIVVDESDVVIMGHGRLLAAQALGLESVPVHCAEGLSKQQVKALRIADNRVSEESRWDMDLLPVEIKELAAMDMNLTPLGFDRNQIIGLIKEIDPANWPEMPTDETKDYEQITFILHKRQAKGVQRAIAKAKQLKQPQKTPNKNSNGNALAMICKEFLHGPS